MASSLQLMTENIESALRRATASFADCSDSAKLDAEILLAHVLRKSRSFLYTWPHQSLELHQLKDFNNLIEQRLQPTPIAYLIGSREFYSLQFEINHDVLVPRPETELLVDKALELCDLHHLNKVIDLGTGSGIIPICLKKQRPDLSITATDISSDCLNLAKRNAIKHQTKINWVQSNWYESLDPDYQFDLIISNPPYIAADESWLQIGDLPAEPLLALSSGETGLESIKVIVRGACQFLTPAGHLIMEHGHEQSDAIVALMAESKFKEIYTLEDFNHLPRLTGGQFIVGKKKAG
ncbi:MAG: release factor glutamine methyltransferase [Gammaproteobacteria bacterium]